MKKHIFLSLFTCAVLTGCSSLAPTVELIETVPTQESETTATESSSEDTQSTTVEETDTAEESSTEEETTKTGSSEPSTDEDGNLIIDITDESPTSASGRMEDYKATYTYKNITINYPILVGMSDTEAMEWANEELYQDAMALLDVYGVDTENDTFTVDYTVSTIYKSEFCLVYSGEYLPDGDTQNAVSVRASDDLDLTQKEHIQLSDRLSSSKLAEALIESGDYTVVSENCNEDNLREYLSKQTEEFYSSLISTADFGSDSVPEGFSYNSMGNVAVIIPVPHMFGDYAEITIVQQTK